MNIDDLILVSVDDHVIEPANMFEGRLERKYVDVAPRFVRRDDGTMAWRYEGQEILNPALNAVAGRPKEEFGAEPTTIEEIRSGCYDIDSRIKDMNANGVLGSLNFPSFPRFCGQAFMETKDHDQAVAMVRAYNDWHIEDWAGTHPGRIIPLAIPMLWDPEAAAAEVRRVAAKGCHAVTFSSNPYDLGLPSLYSDHWDPFWKACEDEGTVVCMHLGSNSKLPVTAPEAPIELVYTLSPVALFSAAADLLWSGIFLKFPSLRIALSEGGIGWLPYFLERVDYIHSHTKYWTGTDLGGWRPSELFSDRVILCFIDDLVGLENRHHLNIDNITWECDYPHSDTTWPQAPEVLMKSLGGVSDDEINKITHLNAMKHFRYDPFVHIPREHATVSALREQAEGWDISVKSVKHLRPAGADSRQAF
ncbi:amidohydrolase family protein [Mycobacterium sp. CVI_P3]|uniref:Amidohydrolase family protein n=1 Tax=Mycobacterium pinniadriaticum TaxID=2994102 RepID=A0ABT3SPP2_9MYCO|nr:amidohydrolase family protein [Mycobacterium pinniadriaticum]MCX2934885.1 amidohydrolase family protein [Mycobacterium pinniadriaticum]MCX2941307.1 amidohydrolase family protein [Mycobacterium pinniadriaticum]